MHTSSFVLNYNFHWSIFFQKARFKDPQSFRRIETHQWLMTNFTRIFQPIPSWLNWTTTFNGPFITSSTDKHYSLDSEVDFRLGCRNVSHQQQFFSELLSPGRSQYTDYLSFCLHARVWPYILFGACQKEINHCLRIYLRQVRIRILSGTQLSVKQWDLTSPCNINNFDVSQ